MPDASPLTLDSVSVLLVWTAIAVYALAFIAYAVDLAPVSYTHLTLPTKA